MSQTIRCGWLIDLLRNCLIKFDQKIRLNQRNVLLFINNCTAHCKLNLKLVKIKFFPPNTISKLQPIDQGIIQNFKTLLYHCIETTFQLYA